MYVSFLNLTLCAVFVTTVDYRFFGASTGIPSITLSEMVSYSLMLLYLGRTTSIKFSLDIDTAVFRKNEILFLYFGWAALASISGLLLRGSVDGIQMFKNFLPSIIIYFFIVKFIITPRHVVSLLWVYIAGICINITLCVSQIFLNGPRPMKIEDAITTKLDFSGQIVSKLATGFFNHPNGLALLLLPAVILIVSVLLFQVFPRALPNTVAFMILILLLFILKYTYAKGVFAWTLIGCALLFIPERCNRWRFGIGVFTLLFFIVGITLYSLSTIVSGGQNSLSTIVTRIYLWVAAFEVIKADRFVQLFGDGFKAMTDASSKIADWEYPNAHNGIINQALFYGIPAMILYLWGFFAAVWRLSKLRFVSDKTIKMIVSFIFSSLIALLGEYFFEPANVGVTLQTQFFILLAMSRNLYMYYNEPEYLVKNISAV